MNNYSVFIYILFFLHPKIYCLQETFIADCAIDLTTNNVVKVLAGQSLTFDGNNNVVFCRNYKEPLFILEANSQLIFQNITIENVYSNTFRVAEGASIIFSKNCFMRLMQDICVSAFNIIGDLTISSNKKMVSVNADQSIKVGDGGTLSFKGSRLRLMGDQSLKIDSLATMIMDNSEFIIGVKSYTFTQGLLKVCNDVLIKNGCKDAHKVEVNFGSNCTLRIMLFSTLKIPFSISFGLQNKNTKILFESTDSNMFLDGCKINFGTNGYTFDNGCLLINDTVFFTANETFDLNVSNALDIKILRGAKLVTNARVRYFESEVV